VSSARAVAPPRPKRPANRRELLRAAAAELFVRHGYANVTIAEVAAAVGVGPSAVYRHFPGKAELLVDVVDTALDRVVAGLLGSAAADLDELARAMAVQTLDNRALGVLLQRESRQLSAEAAARIRRKRVQISDFVTAELSTHRPGLSPEHARLLAICAIDALNSVSFHGQELPRAHYEQLLADLARRVLRFELPVDTRRECRRQRPRAQTRGEEIVDVAIGLLADRGYAEVSLDDIGAAVGMAGPSLYNHFANKQAILAAVMERGHTQLRSAMRAATAHGADPAEVLRRVTDFYVDLALDDPDMITLLISETVHLHGRGGGPDGRAMQRAYIADWVALSLAHNPAQDPVEARIKVQAAQMVANDVARTPRLRRMPGVRAAVRELTWMLQQ